MAAVETKDISDAFSTAINSLNTWTDTAHTTEEQKLHLVSEEGPNSSAETEWDPVYFDLKNSSNPNWKKGGDKHQKKHNSPTKPKRIQDIHLFSLDSGSSGSSNSNSTSSAAADKDYWPYDDESGSPCAMFGKASSCPAEGFDGEFSNGDPEWGEEDQNSRKSGGSREKSRGGNTERRRKDRRKQQQEDEGDEVDGHVDASARSYDLQESHSTSESEGEEVEEEDYGDESDGSVSHSSNYEDDNLMVTPAVGHTRDQRKKPPTLKRGAHGVATPSVVKAMKDRQAFTSDDEGDNQNVDFDADFDSDLDSGGSGHSSRSKNKDNGTKPKREGRLEAANATFRRSSVSKRREQFSFNRALSSADLKAARKANNSFKGHSELNKSFGALAETKRRVSRSKSRSEGKLQNSFSSSSQAKKGSSSHGNTPSSAEVKSARKIPERAKSMGNPTGSGKLKAAIGKFAGSTDEATSNLKPKGKMSSTLSALKALSAHGTGSGESDLKNAIMQQVYASSSGLNSLELKIKPKPKITKASSLSASGMARAAAASGDVFLNKEASKAPPPTAGQRVRRSKTSNERHSASLSDFNASYHESIAKMRKQKMADASERSGLSAGSTKSAVSTGSTKSPATATSPKETKEAPKERPMNLDRRAKSFSHLRSGATASADDDKTKDDANSPGSNPNNQRSPARPGLRRGSSKQSQQSDTGSDLDGASGHSSKRNMSRSGSSRRLQKESSARFHYDSSPQRPKGASVIKLLKLQEPVTDAHMMQKGNRQMFHALMYKTRMGMDMDKLRRKVEGLDVSEEDHKKKDHAGFNDDEEVSDNDGG